MARIAFAVPVSVWLLGGLHCSFLQALTPLALVGVGTVAVRMLAARAAVLQARAPHR